MRAEDVAKEFTIIDCHAHMGPWFNFHIFDNTPGEMLRSMDHLGIQKVCASHHLGIGPDFRRGNAELLEAMEQFPDRFIPYVCFNPRYPKKEAQEELEKFDSLGVPYGIKIHPSVHQYPANGENYKPLWEFAEEKGLPLLCHTWEKCSYGPPELLGELAEEHPHVKVILGHSGGSIEGQLESIEIAKRRRNVHLDLTGSQLFYGMLEKMVKEIGASRVLFGTDIPFIDPKFQLGRVLFSRLSQAQKRKILGLNTARIFGIIAKDRGVG